MRVRYARCIDLLNDLYAGLADGTYLTRMKRWAAPELLVMDDVGLGQVKQRADEPTAAHTLFDLLDRRHGRVATAMSSNINLSDWGRYLGDATLAAAILDRVAMRAIRIDIDGPSYRQKVAKQRADQDANPPQESQDRMTKKRKPPPRHAQIHLPVLDPDEALRFVDLLERICTAIWKAHGQQMSERLVDSYLLRQERGADDPFSDYDIDVDDLPF